MMIVFFFDISLQIFNRCFAIHRFFASTNFNLYHVFIERLYHNKYKNFTIITNKHPNKSDFFGCLLMYSENGIFSNQLKLAVFDCCYLSDSCRVSAALKFCIEEEVNQFNRNARADNSAAHAEDVCIVVQTGVFCAEVVGAACRADTLDLVDCHRHADACAADENALFAFAVSHAVTDCRRDGCVIYRSLGVCAEVLEFDVVLCEIFDDFLFQGESAVIASDSYHFNLLLCMIVIL